MIYRALISVSVLFLFIPQVSSAFWPFQQNRQAPVVAMPVVERETQVEVKEFTRLVSKIAEDLYNNLEDPDPQVGDLAGGILVSTFVDLKKLYRTSSFGRYLAEQMITELQHRKFVVAEIRKSKSINIQEKRGEFGLSREPEEIASSFSVGAMLTGTYTVLEDHILVNARILDNRDSTLLTSSTIIFPRNKLTDSLLADSSSAKKGNKIMVYKKALEL